MISGYRKLKSGKQHDEDHDRETCHEQTHTHENDDSAESIDEHHHQGHDHSHVHKSEHPHHDHCHQQQSPGSFASNTDVDCESPKTAFLLPKSQDKHPILTPQMIQAEKDQRKLVLATVFVSFFFIVEIVGGVLAGSIAIMTDAAHLLTDISSFVLAIIATRLATLPPSKDMSYGMVRAEVLAALLSTLLIWLLTGGLMWEASIRIYDYCQGDAHPVNGPLMTGIAIMGLAVNVILIMILGLHSHDHSQGGEGHSHDAHSHGHDHSHAHGGHSPKELSKSPSPEPYGSINTNKEPEPIRSANISAAYLHAISDFIQNIGVIIAGVIIWCRPDFQIVDPLCTILFAILVVSYTLNLLHRTVFVLLEAVPSGVDWERVHKAFSAIEGVSDVHDLHIWSLTVGRHAATAHMKATNPEQALRDAHSLARELGLSHVTIQVQKDTCAPDDCNHPCVSSDGEQNLCCPSIN